MGLWKNKYGRQYDAAETREEKNRILVQWRAEVRRVDAEREQALKVKHPPTYHKIGKRKLIRRQRIMQRREGYAAGKMMDRMFGV